MNAALAALTLRVLDLETINRLNAVMEAERAANEVGNAAAYSEAVLRAERIRKRTAEIHRLAVAKHVAADALQDCAYIDADTAGRVIAVIAAGDIPGVSIAY